MKNILYSLFKFLNQPGKDKVRLQIRAILVHAQLLLVLIEYHRKFWSPSGISLNDVAEWKFDLINNLDGFACVIEQTLDDPEQSLFNYM